MCKERLEIIKKLRETILEENDFRTRCVLAYAFVNLGYMDWLIGQAERVQELENQLHECQNCGFEYHKQHEDVDGGYTCPACEETKLKKQNKRYREAIEVAIQNIVACKNLGVKFALKILEQALEGEE